MFCFECGGREYSPMAPLVIAEIGTAHQGSREKARELINRAAEAGANCIKFQWVYAREILHPLTGKVSLPGGSVSLYEEFEKLEQTVGFYSFLKEETEKTGALFLCSPFGPESLSELLSLAPKALKIASPELNYFQLIKKAALSGLPLILSTGVSKPKDIENSINWIKEALCRPDGVKTYNPQDKALPDSKLKGSHLLFLHCVTSYPAREEEYNLSLIGKMEKATGFSWGVSDHSLDPVLVPLLSLLQGGCAVEKHFTLSNLDSGLDDKIALSPEKFKIMTEALKEGVLAIREGSEEKLLNELFKVYGKKRIISVLGNGRKKLSKSEKKNYGRTNRSVHAMVDLKKGHLIKTEDLGILRTEKILSPGDPPVNLEKILGKELKKDIKAGMGIRQKDVRAARTL